MQASTQLLATDCIIFTPRIGTNTLTTSYWQLNSNLIHFSSYRYFICLSHHILLLLLLHNHHHLRMFILEVIAYEYIYLWLFAELKRFDPFSRGYKIAINFSVTPNCRRLSLIPLLYSIFFRAIAKGKTQLFCDLSEMNWAFFHRKNANIQFHLLFNR